MDQRSTSPAGEPVQTAAAVAEKPSGSRSPFGGFSALSLRAYQFYVVSITLQGMAENMQMLANGWYAYQLTGSTAVLGLTLLAQAIPQILFSFVGGVVSDRFSRRTVWMVTVVLTGMLALWLGISVLFGTIIWEDLVIRAFLFGCILAFRMPARQGLMNDIAGREHIMSAVSLQTMAENVMQFAGPATAGFLIAGLGIGSAYFIITAFYVVAALCQFFIQVPKKPVSTAKRESMLTSAKEGFKYIRRTPNVGAVLVFTLAASALATPYQQLLPAYAKQVLALGPAQLGILTSLTGVGALIGSVSMTIIRPKTRGPLFIKLAFFWGAVLVAFCATNSFQIAGAIALAIGAGQACALTLGLGLLNTYTESGYLGRVLSIRLTQNGLSTLSGFIVALGAEVVGVRWAIMFTSGMLVMVGAGYWVFSRRLRTLA